MLYAKDLQNYLSSSNLVLDMARREPGWFNASWGPTTFNEMQFTPASAFEIFGGYRLQFDANIRGSGFIKADGAKYANHANNEWKDEKNRGSYSNSYLRF